MARLALIGAGGTVGSALVHEARKRGHELRVLRHRSAIADAGPDVVDGDARDPAALEALVAGTDAVIVAIRARRGDRALAASSMRALLAAMRDQRVRRLIVVLSAGVRSIDRRDARRDRLLSFLLRLAIGRRLRDAELAYRILRETPEVDWTVVRPGRLTEEEPTRPARHGLDLAVGSAATPALVVADFVLDQLTDTAYVGRAPRVRG